MIIYYKNTKDNIIRQHDITPNTKYTKTIDININELHPGFTKVVNGKIDNSLYDEYIKQYDYLEELEQIKQWFNDNDWKVNKIVIGEWGIDDSRWAEYLNERLEKRNRQDELSSLLKEKYKY